MLVAKEDTWEELDAWEDPVAGAALDVDVGDGDAATDVDEATVADDFAIPESTEMPSEL